MIVKACLKTCAACNKWSGLQRRTTCPLVEGWQYSVENIKVLEPAKSDNYNSHIVTLHR